jgi:hypothetical protein
MWYIHDIPFYSALKGNGILIQATAWVNLEDNENKAVKKDK